MKQSKKWTLSKQDWTAWGNRTLQNLAPYLVALIPVFIEQIPKDWEYTVIAVWLLNRIWDLLRRLYIGK